MLFPQLDSKSFDYVDLEKEATDSKRYKKINGQNPLLNPVETQKLVDDYHQRKGLQWSYGGWMENRAKLWSGSYMDAQKTYLHLGIDYNVPEGTEVALPWSSKVIRIDHDSDLNGGWGGRIIVQPEKLPDLLFIFAHLSKAINAKVHQTLKAGSIIGSVGSPEVNGGWFSHLHIQAITHTEFERAMKNDLSELDGYTSLQKKREAKIAHPNPNLYIDLKGKG